MRALPSKARRRHPVEASAPRGFGRNHRRKAALVAALACVAAGPAASALAGELAGWGDFHFGMTAAEVQRIAGAGAQAGADISGIPVVIWDADVFGEKVQVAAFLPDGKLDAINLTLPDMADSNDRECFARLTRIVDELTKVHGTPDERSPKMVSDEGAASWHAIFKFDSGAAITASSTLTDFDSTCSTELIYDATP